MISKLIKLANKLDLLGFIKEADFVDYIIKHAHKKNKTPYRALDKLALDPRIESIYEERKYGSDYWDGIWIDLMPGYNFEGMGTFCSGSGADTDWDFEKRIMIKLTPEQILKNIFKSMEDDVSRIEVGEPS
jgi:hypothetical protein